MPLLPYEALRAGVNGDETYIRHYARYWHGNTFLTRYLLVCYDGTWVAKWIVATLFTSENVIADGFKNTFIRTAGLDDVTRWDAVGANVELLPWMYIAPVLVLLAVLAAVRLNGKGWRKAVQLLPVVVLPWVWYLAVANHSYLHSWFTFRAQAASVAAMVLAVAAMVDWNKLFGYERKDKRVQGGGAGAVLQ